MRQGCDRERKSGAPSQPEPHANSQNMVDTQDMLVGRMAGKRAAISQQLTKLRKRNNQDIHLSIHLFTDKLLNTACAGHRSRSPGLIL